MHRKQSNNFNPNPAKTYFTSFKFLDHFHVNVWHPQGCSCGTYQHQSLSLEALYGTVSGQMLNLFAMALDHAKTNAESRLARGIIIWPSKNCNYHLVDRKDWLMHRITDWCHDEHLRFVAELFITRIRSFAACLA